ncbi:MAG: 50S ribosomal protein L11 methyltransferase [Paludibacteraceae bacterium]|nr:50S ribosomal protein L11 methyltransferase [Paludibacteraceae bacterium]
MQYSQSIFRVKATEDFVKDVLTQQLADIGYESFVEQEDGTFAAYIPAEKLSMTILRQLLEDFPFQGITLVSTELCEDKDWNEEWEKNSFQPILIGNDCIIHAPFHRNIPVCKYDILINPKMAFGTGTHQTTSLILGELLQTDLQGKSLLDMGCGTAVLALLARKRGANPVTAIDIDNWCTENATENCTLNNISDIEILLGDSRLLQGRHFDFILANINRNILLMDMPRYKEALNNRGRLIMSGFYTEDIAAIKEKAEELGLTMLYVKEKEKWAMTVFCS